MENKEGAEGGKVSERGNQSITGRRLCDATAAVTVQPLGARGTQSQSWQLQRQGGPLGQRGLLPLPDLTLLVRTSSILDSPVEVSTTLQDSGGVGREAASRSEAEGEAC